MPTCYGTLPVTQVQLDEMWNFIQAQTCPASRPGR